MATVDGPGADERGMLPAPGAEPSEAVSFGRQPRRDGASGFGDGIRVTSARRLARRSTDALMRAVEAERDRGTGFVLLPVLLCVGAAVYWSLPLEPQPFVPPALAGFCACATIVARRGVARAAALALLTLALGVLAAQIETRRAGTAMMGSEISTALTGRVVLVERQASGRVRLTIDVESTARPQLRYAPDRVRISARAVPEGLSPGDGVSGYARLFPPSGPARPHGYDFAFESYMAGIGATGFFLSEVERAPLSSEPGWRDRLAARVARMRDEIAARIEARIGGPEGAIAAALIAGTRAGIPEEINEDLRKTGLAHVLSISGLHMALVAGTVISVLRLGFALAPGFASRHPVKKYAAAAALVAASYYLVICGAAVAAQRSFIMIAVMLVALLFDRAAITMRNLAIAALIVVAVSPHEVVGPSFQMSFAATAALIAAYAAWSELRSRRPPEGAPNRTLLRAGLQRAGGWLAGIAMTSLIAGSATALYGVWHFHRMSPLGLVANLLAMPVVSLVVMPPAVLAGVLMPFGLEGPALDLMGGGIGVMLAIARWLAERTPFDAVGAVPLSAVVALTVALVLATALTTWLRAIALPFLVAGLALTATRDLPEFLVSEDGSLAAMRTASGELAVNRARPNAFVTGMWKHALMAEEVVRPRPLAPGTEAAVALVSLAPGTGFRCDGPLCIARHHGGAAVALLPEGTPIAPYCGVASVIILDDATARGGCAGRSAATVLTRRDLARRGSAELGFKGTDTGDVAGGGLWSMPQVLVRQAIAEPFRPWHEHRRFSRAARGMPPYRRAESPAVPGIADGATPATEAHRARRNTGNPMSTPR
jgi:ComEC/Rec2-related protein